MTQPGDHRLVMILVVAVGVAAAPLAGSATMYECGVGAGPRVFTDSPAQLKNCVPIGGISHGASPVAAAPVPAMPPPAAMPTESVHSVDMDRPPSYFPTAMVPPPGTPPVADRDIGLAPIPHEPTAAATPAEPVMERCASSINPFNPLMAVPCPASGTQAQQMPLPEAQLPPLPVSPEGMPFPQP